MAKRKSVTGIAVLILLLVVSLALSGCGPKQADPGGDTGKPERLSTVMGTSGVGGSWYPYASRIAGITMRETTSRITVIATGGGVENLRLMKQGEIGMGQVEAAVMHYAYEGIKIFEGDKMPFIRFVAQMYPITFQAAVPRASTIMTLHDLKGKSFSPGSAGSGDEVTWLEVFEAYGMSKSDMDWRPLTHTERAMAFKDRTIDGVGYETVVPAGTLLEAASLVPLRLLAIEGDYRKNLMAKYPWYTEWVIPAGTYNGQDEDVQTVATFGIFVAHENVPEQLVYDFVKSMFDKVEEVRTLHTGARLTSLDMALHGRGDIPLHPGAERYYREVGLIK